MSARDALQEMLELGARRYAFRVWWEIRVRSGLMAWLDRPARGPATLPEATVARDLFADPAAVRSAMAGRICEPDRDQLRELSDLADKGKIFGFGRHLLDMGNPPDWHRDPRTGKRWPDRVHWSRALNSDPTPGDIKLTWEAARFPHAFHMARAATFWPERADAWMTTLSGQMESFYQLNPRGQGIHWHSGLEIATRWLAWTFAREVFRRLHGPSQSPLWWTRAAMESGDHLERHISFSLHAVPNDHLIGEGLGLFLLGELSPRLPGSAGWRSLGESILDDAITNQFYSDGGYLQQSFNYHRAVLQMYLWAWRLNGGRWPARWRTAVERSLDMLVAHQNPADGRLPNYGFNDGSQAHILSTGDFADFRPTLQATSLATRGERLYPPGPWDEEAAWLCGIEALEMPLKPPQRTSISFPVSGCHVLRGEEPGNYAMFRCGRLRDRFGQIDMLHLDVWWRGHNVLVDAGSYLYNGPEFWHNHFMRTASHNTITVNGADQMLHYRKFKCLYWTDARVVHFERHPRWELCQGEHHGYRRHPGGVVHSRSVLHLKDALWVVVDHLTGTGTHEMRLHWLAGDFPYRAQPAVGRLELATPAGDFLVQVRDADGAPVAGDVASGQIPPRGWLSRYYAEKSAVPSMVVSRHRELPCTFVSVLGGAEMKLEMDKGRWLASAAGRSIQFRLHAGGISDVEVDGS